MEISQLWLWPPVINMSEELLNICNAFIVILHLKECIDPPHSRGATYTGGQTKSLPLGNLPLTLYITG